MLSGLCRNSNKFRFFFLQHFFIITILINRSEPKFFRFFLHCLLINVADCYELKIIISGRLYVIRTDSSTSNKCILHTIIPPFYIDLSMSCIVSTNSFVKFAKSYFSAPHLALSANCFL